LRFPKKYFQKNLANKKADFKVKIINVYQREIQESNNDFAQSMGFESMTKLNKKLEENIKKDKENKEEQRWEREIIEYIIQKSKLEDLPEKLIHNETHKMIHELEHNIQSQGMDMPGYLKSIKKNKDDLRKDFEPQAKERVNAALVLRQISKEEKIIIKDEEINKYINKQKEIYKDNKEALKNLNDNNYRIHIMNILANKKVINFVKSKVT
jgi:trigger factor